MSPSFIISVAIKPETIRRLLFLRFRDTYHFGHPLETTEKSWHLGRQVDQYVGKRLRGLVAADVLASTPEFNSWGIKLPELKVRNVWSNCFAPVSSST